MAFYKRTNYRKLYPEASNEVIQVLEQSDRKMKYLLYDLKKEVTLVDMNDNIVLDRPCREESLEDLLENNKQFQSDENIEDMVIKKEMYQTLYHCLSLLDPEDQTLIKGLFFEHMSETVMSATLGIHQSSVNRRKEKILKKLRDLLEE